jgi:acetyl-CoA synthetase
VPNGHGGILVIKRPWPSMIRNLWGEPERYRKASYPEELGGKLDLAGDGSARDEETGYFTIMGRIDNCRPWSPTRGSPRPPSSVFPRPHWEANCAFVVLKQARPAGAEAEKIAKQLRGWIGKEIGPIAKPKDISRRQPAQDAFGHDHAAPAALDRQRRNDHADMSTLENPAINTPRADSIGRRNARAADSNPTESAASSRRRRGASPALLRA